ncbi:MAG: ABC transporter permease [Patescibacteria group bacterium]|nr:ABC transporter permease [Patescibacteria group bacterium]
MFAVVLRTLKDKKNALFTYTSAALGFLLMYVALYPSIQKMDKTYEDMAKMLPEGLMKAFGLDINTLGTFEGYISTEFFSMVVPIMVIAFAVSFAGWAIAGEIEKGTVEILLAQPISRLKAFLSKYIAGFSYLALFIGVSILSVIPMAKIFDFSIKSGNFLKVTGITFLFGLAVYSLGVLFSSIFSEKGKVYLATSGILILMYVLNIIAVLKDNLKDLKYFSFFHYYNPSEVLVKGKIDWLGVWIFLLVAFVSTVLAAFWFKKRDIAT